MNDKVKELIELYEAILHGDKKDIGLFDCYDKYYKGCWDDKLKQVENLKKKLVKNLSIDVVSKRFSEQDMVDAAEYGYNYRDTTSFPDKNFEDNCKNNVKQWLSKYD